MTGLSILAVDDEAPSLDELSYLLHRSTLVENVAVARSAADALRRLDDEEFDAVLVDIRMPGLDGMALARVLGRFASPPVVIFVTAHEDHALEAFEVDAAGYLLKPVDEERLDRLLRRAVVPAHQGAGPSADHDRRAEGLTTDRAADRPTEDRPTEDRPTEDRPTEDRPTEDRPTEENPATEVVAVDAGNRTLLVDRADIAWVESAGDYVRIHLRDGTSHLLRVPMAALEEHWTDHGFARIHRGYLVSLRDISELCSDGGRTEVRVLGETLPVSRRQLRELRDRLVRHVGHNGR